MTTEQYSIGYDAGYQDGFDAALAEPVKQEPVAVISESAIGLVKLHSNGACLPFGTQLYAAPVSAKREWVDLTDDEIRCCWLHAAIARRVIAAFKEKNK